MSAPASHFLVFDEALTLHEVLQRQGFALQPEAATVRMATHLMVEMAWVRARSGERATLALKVHLSW